MTTVLDPLVAPDWAPKIQVVLFRARAVTQFLVPSHSETNFVVVSRSTAFEDGLLGSSFSSDPRNWYLTGCSPLTPLPIAGGQAQSLKFSGYVLWFVLAAHPYVWKENKQIVKISFFGRILFSMVLLWRSQAACKRKMNQCFVFQFCVKRTLGQNKTNNKNIPKATFSSPCQQKNKKKHMFVPKGFKPLAKIDS